MHFEAGLARGEGGARAGRDRRQPIKADYAFLSLKSPAFDLSDRGVAGRQVPAGLDAFVYTERGVYRSGETVHVTALLRDARGVAAPNVAAHAGGRAAGRRRISPRAASPTRASAATAGACRSSPRPRPAPGACAAYTDPKRPPVGETTFMVEDYVPDRIEFDLTSAAKVISRNAPAQLSVDGHFLYGAPASNLDLQGTVDDRGRQGAAGFRRLCVRPRRRRGDRGAPGRSTTCRRPTPTGKASFPVKLDKVPATIASAGSDRSPSAWRNPAAARSSASSRCRSRPTRR